MLMVLICCHDTLQPFRLQSCWGGCFLSWSWTFSPFHVNICIWPCIHTQVILLLFARHQHTAGLKAVVIYKHLWSELSAASAVWICVIHHFFQLITLTAGWALLTSVHLSPCEQRGKGCQATTDVSFASPAGLLWLIHSTALLRGGRICSRPWRVHQTSTPDPHASRGQI